MTMPGEASLGATRSVAPPGAGLWSTTGLAAPGQSTVFSQAAPAVRGSGAGPSSALSPTTIVPAAAKLQTGRARTFKCPQISCCTTCPCSRKCCPCSFYRVLCWSCAIVVLFVVVVGIVLLVLWKVLKPKFPGYNVENVHFAYHVTTSPTPGSYILNADTNFTMVLSNPNTKIGVLYDKIAMNLHLFGLAIGDQAILGTFDGPGITKYIEVDMESGNVPLDADTQASLMAAENDNDVPVNLDIIVRLRAKIGLVLTPAIQITLLCLLDINPSAPPASQLQNMSCKFKLKLAG